MTPPSLTVLVDNTVGAPRLLAEHGLAIWLDCGDRQLLFDTGAGRVLADNARTLGIDLAQAAAVILSHGHYDHSGGLARLLDHTPRLPLYLHPAALQPKFSRQPDGSCHAIGMPADADPVARADVRFTTGPMRVTDGLQLTGPIPRTTDFEDTGGAFYLDPDCTEPDPLSDDQAAFLDTPSGTTVILGCAHSGIINTLHYILELTDDRPIHTVIGGMHLVHASPARLTATVTALRKLDIKRLYPMHCTGFQAVSRLCREFPGRVHPAPAGTQIAIP